MILYRDRHGTLVRTRTLGCRLMVSTALLPEIVSARRLGGACDTQQLYITNQFNHPSLQVINHTPQIDEMMNIANLELVQHSHA